MVIVGSVWLTVPFLWHTTSCLANSDKFLCRTSWSTFPSSNSWVSYSITPYFYMNCVLWSILLSILITDSLLYFYSFRRTLILVIMWMMLGKVLVQCVWFTASVWYPDSMCMIFVVDNIGRRTKLFLVRHFSEKKNLVLPSPLSICTQLIDAKSMKWIKKWNFICLAAMIVVTWAHALEQIHYFVLTWCNLLNIFYLALFTSILSNVLSLRSPPSPSINGYCGCA